MRMSRIKQVGSLLAFLVFLTLTGSVYVVNQYEQAIVLQFGEPVRVVQEAGLKFKVPFIQNIVYYDTRLLNLDPPAQEIVLGDKKRLDVDSFTRYQIVDPLKFYKTVRTELQAQSKLEEIVNSSVRNVLGRITLQELLSEKRSEIMTNISSAVKNDAAQIGVKVAEVRIRRADLPMEVLQAINDRMKAERKRDAKEARAQGLQAAQQIKAKAEKESTIIVAEAEKKSQIIKGEGDKEATQIWNEAASVDVEFYAFYRSMEAYKKAMANSDNELILSPDSAFFKYFKNKIGQEN